MAPTNPSDNAANTAAGWGCLTLIALGAVITVCQAIWAWMAPKIYTWAYIGKFALAPLLVAFVAWRAVRFFRLDGGVGEQTKFLIKNGLAIGVFSWLYAQLFPLQTYGQALAFPQDHAAVTQASTQFKENKYKEAFKALSQVKDTSPYFPQAQTLHASGVKTAMTHAANLGAGHHYAEAVQVLAAIPNGTAADAERNQKFKAWRKLAVRETAERKRREALEAQRQREAEAAAQRASNLRFISRAEPIVQGIQKLLTEDSQQLGNGAVSDYRVIKYVKSELEAYSSDVHRLPEENQSQKQTKDDLDVVIWTLHGGFDAAEDYLESRKPSKLNEAVEAISQSNQQFKQLAFLLMVRFGH